MHRACIDARLEFCRDPRCVDCLRSYFGLLDICYFRASSLFARWPAFFDFGLLLLGARAFASVLHGRGRTGSHRRFRTGCSVDDARAFSNILPDSRRTCRCILRLCLGANVSSLGGWRCCLTAIPSFASLPCPPRLGRSLLSYIRRFVRRARYDRSPSHPAERSFERACEGLFSSPGQWSKWSTLHLANRGITDG